MKNLNYRAKKKQNDIRMYNVNQKRKRDAERKKVKEGKEEGNRVASSV